MEKTTMTLDEAGRVINLMSVEAVQKLIHPYVSRLPEDTDKIYFRKMCRYVQTLPLEKLYEDFVAS